MGLNLTFFFDLSQGITRMIRDKIKSPLAKTDLFGNIRLPLHLLGED